MVDAVAVVGTAGLVRLGEPGDGDEGGDAGDERQPTSTNAIRRPNAAVALRRMEPAKQTRSVNAYSTRSSDTISGLLRLG